MHWWIEGTVDTCKPGEQGTKLSSILLTMFLRVKFCQLTYPMVWKPTVNGQSNNDSFKRRKGLINDAEVLADVLTDNGVIHAQTRLL
jgi:hypothetical protein